jgi:hypothetical protein
MPDSDYPEAFIEAIKAIKNKRPRIVAEHILAHGVITTEELSELYGYEHPPRAARDLRDAGIPLETFKAKNKEGRTIAAYRFGNVDLVQPNRWAGRRAFSRKFKQALLDQYGTRCAICHGEFAPRYLQIDHRVPYHIAGDIENVNHVEGFMLVCGTCNRAKSWSCEHCQNWTTKDKAKCVTCYWASPEDHTHIALVPMRRLDLHWSGKEIVIYERLNALAVRAGTTLPDYIKAILRKLLE